jgi:hypothetical protein
MSAQTTTSAQPRCSLAVIGAAGALELDFDAVAPLFAEVLLCVDPPLAPRLRAPSTHPSVALVGPLVQTEAAGRPLAQLVAALAVCRAEHVVALDAALLSLLRPQTLACLTELLPGDAGDVVRLVLSLDNEPAGNPGFTPARYRRGCRRALERALRGGRFEPAAALRGLRIATIKGA